MSHNFQQYSRYYDLFYQDKNYRAEASFVDSCLRPYIAPGAHLLELGCGTGRHAEHICGAGYRVTGLDRSADMLAAADDKKIPGFNTVQADITSFNLPVQFDAAFSLFHVVSYLTTNAQLAACFQQVSQHLKPGGVFCFDCWYGPAVLHELPEKRFRQLQEGNLELTRVATPLIDIEQNTVKVQYNLSILHRNTGERQELTEDHLMRYFSIPEIRWIAEHAGFTVLQASEYLTAAPTTLNTWNLFILLQKVA